MLLLSLSDGSPGWRWPSPLRSFQTFPCTVPIPTICTVRRAVLLDVSDSRELVVTLARKSATVPGGSVNASRPRVTGDTVVCGARSALPSHVTTCPADVQGKAEDELTLLSWNQVGVVFFCWWFCVG